MSDRTKGTKRLLLMAEDAADLQLLSAALQDAVAQVGDIRFERAARRLTLMVNRFRWEAPAGGERVRAALQLSAVLSVRQRNIRREPKDAVVNLLSLDFHPKDEPAGLVLATFSGGGELRCEVECLDAMLADVSAPWPTRGRPAHDATDR